VPDRIVILNQKILFVELKTQTGKLSPRQVVVFDQLGEAGFPVHILRSKDDVDDFIDEVV
jgi:predicted Holliday junction resolvase-like endonuclease